MLETSSAEFDPRQTRHMSPSWAIGVAGGINACSRVSGGGGVTWAERPAGPGSLGIGSRSLGVAPPCGSYIQPGSVSGRTAIAITAWWIAFAHRASPSAV